MIKVKTFTLNFREWKYGGSVLKIDHFGSTHNIGDFDYRFTLHKHRDRVYLNRTKWTPFVVVTWEVSKTRLFGK
jgi:hypothetical protein